MVSPICGSSYLPAYLLGTYLPVQTQIHVRLSLNIMYKEMRIELFINLLDLNSVTYYGIILLEYLRLLD